MQMPSVTPKDMVKKAKKVARRVSCSIYENAYKTVSGQSVATMPAKNRPKPSKRKATSRSFANEIRRNRPCGHSKISAHTRAAVTSVAAPVKM